MTAAERAVALARGEPIECPRCDAIMKDDQHQEYPPLTCACGFSCSRRMVGLIGKPGDSTAAIHLTEKDYRG